MDLSSETGLGNDSFLSLPGLLKDFVEVEEVQHLPTEWKLVL